MIDSVKYDPNSPKTTEDIVGNSAILKKTAGLISTNQCSHIVLVGPPGCGKTLFLRIVLSKLHTLFIDCTANFGLRDVRDSIRIFARGSRVNGNLRWIVFEHADALTADTQAFLRRMLETTAASTRIVFECRDAGAISEPVLSRSSMITMHSPEATESAYELLRRTDFKLDRKIVDAIVKSSQGNMRKAVLLALSHVHCPTNSFTTDYTIVHKLLERRPTCKEEYVAWAIMAETECRLNGIDLREVLQQGWPNNPAVSQTVSLWSRLGGTSPRALFFGCVSQLIAA